LNSTILSDGIVLRKANINEYIIDRFVYQETYINSVFMVPEQALVAGNVVQVRSYDLKFENKEEPYV
jgi:hypothetical protein